MRGKCWVYGDFLWEPKWLYLSPISTWYFLSQTTAARPQTYLLLESSADKLYFVPLVFQKITHSCVYTHACLRSCSWLCVFESGCIPVTLCVYVACKFWKDGKRTFFRPENNWSPEPLRVAHPCEVRVRPDQHLIIYQQKWLLFFFFLSAGKMSPCYILNTIMLICTCFGAQKSFWSMNIYYTYALL